MNKESTESLTDAAYWNRTWFGRAIPKPLDPRARGLRGTLERYWHSFFLTQFQGIGIQPGNRLLEAGCGGSIFLPYFAREYQLTAEGIDNSHQGCELSIAISRQSGVHTPIHAADVLCPPASLLRRYRVVFSIGLVEHFSPTTSIVSALAAFLEPTGYLVTIVPNMRGLVGALQRFVDPTVYHLHVPLSPKELADAHRACGLTVLSAEHAMTASFSVVNFDGPNSRIPPRVGLRLTSWTSKAIWSLQRIGLPDIPNGWTSPYIVVVARQTT
jgi:2-polyprenyl-3-methyl-5-hydroxy-6-metoxy-1,4-benzoquinol methylase